MVINGAEVPHQIRNSSTLEALNYDIMRTLRELSHVIEDKAQLGASVGRGYAILRT